MNEIQEKSMVARSKNLAKLLSECIDFEDHGYIPSDFRSPLEFKFPYENSLGRANWEMIAATVIDHSQDEGVWTYIKNIEESYDIEGMMRAGFLRKTDKGYTLTPRALDRIAEKYLLD